MTYASYSHIPDVHDLQQLVTSLHGNTGSPDTMKNEGKSDFFNILKIVVPVCKILQMIKIILIRYSLQF